LIIIGVIVLSATTFLPFIVCRKYENTLIEIVEEAENKSWLKEEKRT